MDSAVRQNPAQSRFELEADGDTAYAYYRLDGNTVIFHHTETPFHLQGRGIASRLIRGALEQVRAQGLKIVPRCSFVAAYLARHPEFNDLLA